MNETKTILKCNRCKALFVARVDDGEITLVCELCLARAKRRSA